MTLQNRRAAQTALHNEREVQEMRELNTLPQEVQEKVKNVLKAYDEVHVTFEDGDFYTSTGVALKAAYAKDFEVIGTYRADEVYTKEERMLNYINVFQDYPIEYKGKRNYKDFHTGKRETFKFDDNGNLVIA